MTRTLLDVEIITKPNLMYKSKTAIRICLTNAIQVSEGMFQRKIHDCEFSVDDFHVVVMSSSQSGLQHIEKVKNIIVDSLTSSTKSRRSDTSTQKPKAGDEIRICKRNLLPDGNIKSQTEVVDKFKTELTSYCATNKGL